ncbi:dolichol-phosphate mannose synthase subunit 3 isoform X1 [Nicotiana tabacum]|uniref:Dolichol-phosphate mannosyltransferase subunit 3 n=4 Tax=Nicotiana TaxID=4085 RepID=A0A1S4AHL8_TOBAC|nr:PREDICTED: dolichol-phosphate mannosyltransferase subunit 3-like isoform X1 [Nicotiana sylvestris]XP_016476195.1 PREDICTED: dolichol-phosphate mannosyltransferase subunit 3-like isoform X1 [Nicotiana tabacum]
MPLRFFHSFYRRRSQRISLQSTKIQMKQIVKILTIVFGVSALWIGLLQTSVVPENYTWLLPLYLIVSLGCYGLLMVGVGLMKFPTCPQEAVYLQQDVREAKELLQKKGVDVGSD